jgi:hypothetical protein
MRAFKYMMSEQKKLTAALFGGLLLVGGLVAPCSNEKYSAFSLAVAGLFSALVAGHAYVGGKEADTKPDAP